MRGGGEGGGGVPEACTALLCPPRSDWGALGWARGRWVWGVDAFLPGADVWARPSRGPGVGSGSAFSRAVSCARARGGSIEVSGVQGERGEGSNAGAPGDAEAEGGPSGIPALQMGVSLDQGEEVRGEKEGRPGRWG